MKENEEKRQERMKKFQLEQEKLKEIIRKKKLFQDMEKQWFESLQESEEQKRKIIEERKKNRSIDYKELNQHAKKYEEILDK